MLAMFVQNVRLFSLSISLESLNEFYVNNWKKIDKI